jgi:hypothetical protein
VFPEYTALDVALKVAVIALLVAWQVRLLRRQPSRAEAK